MFKPKSVIANGAMNAFEEKGAKVLNIASGLGSMQRQAANDLIAQLRARGGEYSKTILVNHVLLWEDIIEDPVDASTFDDASRKGIRESLQTLQKFIDNRKERVGSTDIPSATKLVGLEALVDAQLDLLEECEWDGKYMGDDGFRDALELMSGLCCELVANREQRRIKLGSGASTPEGFIWGVTE